MTDVFISYSRVDTSTVRRIHDALIEHGKTPWVDWEGIPKGVEYMDEIFSAIESADCFLIAISPELAESEICRQELEHAIKHHKQLVPVLLRDTRAAELPPEIARINWVMLRDKDTFAEGIRDLVTVMETNPVWAKTHTRVLTQSLRWEAAGRDPSLLLRGRELNEAERQFGESTDDQSPRPTSLQRQFLIASRTQVSRFLRNLLVSISTALVAVLVLAVLAWFLKLEADENSRLAAEKADLYARSTLSLQLDRVRNEIDQRQFDSARVLLQDDVRCPPHLRSFAWRYYADQSRRQRFRLSGHQAPINCLDRSADGRFVASASDDHSIRLWDSKSFDRVNTLEGHRDEVWSVAFSPVDSKLLVSGSRDGELLQWNLAEPTRPRTVSKRSDENSAVTDVAFHPDGKKLAVAYIDGLIRIVETNNWTLVDHESLESRVSDIDWSDDGTLLATGSTDGKVYLWNARLSLKKQFAAHSAGVWSVSFTPNTRQVVTGGDDGKLRLWSTPWSDGSNGHEVVQDQEVDSNGMIHEIEVSSNGDRIVWGSSAGSIHVWNRMTGQLDTYQSLGDRSESQPVMRAIYSICWVDDGNAALTGMHDGTIRFWRTNDPSTRLQIAADQLNPDVVFLNRMGTIAAIATIDGDVYWRRLRADVANTPLQPLTKSEGSSNDTQVVSNADEVVSLLRQPRAFLVAQSDDGSLMLPIYRGANSADVYRIPNGEKVFAVTADTAPISWAEFRPNGKQLVVCDYDGGVGLYDTSTGRSIASMRLTQAIYRTAFDSDGQRLFVSLADGTIRVIALPTGRALQSLRIPKAGVSITDLFFDEANNRLLVVADASVFYSSNDPDSARLSLFIKGDRTVSHVACTNDGRVLATGHQDGSIRLWDSRTGDLRAEMDGVDTRINDLLFDPSDRILFVPERSGSIRRYISEMPRPEAD